ncbi:MAG: RNA polymerase sigma factor [Gemmatimonadota bacterium]|jgi:RNA polymerase sigma-70 factor (ECF subfamily)
MERAVDGVRPGARSGIRAPAAASSGTREAATPAGEPEDAVVVRRVLAGDVDAFDRLVARYGDVMYRHAERMVGDADEAADLVQTAFVRGFRNLARCDPERVGGWLFRILSNLCKDHLKSPRRRHVRLDDPGELPQSGYGGPEEELERRELARELERGLSRLTPEQREAFVMKHHEGLSYEEMSVTLGVAPAALKMRVHRGREALRTLLEGRT